MYASSGHTALLVMAGLGLVMYVVGIPVFIAYITVWGQRHDMLANETFLRRYGEAVQVDRSG